MEARSMENKTKLHEDLIWEILLKLPVKSLIRFKCVSHSWLSLLSDDKFAKLHFDLTASHTPKLVFGVSVVDSNSNKAQIRSIDPEAEAEASLDSERSLKVHSVNLVSPFPSPLETHHVSILGVCRGFILLGHSPKLKPWWEGSGPPENLLVWNPSTGIHTTLSYSEIGYALVRSPNQSIRVSYHFEYDAFTDDYFVVTAWIQRNNIDRIELFSLRTNSWKQFDTTHLPYTKSWYNPAFLFVNGAIHWLAIDKGELVKAIIAFDLTERNCSEIPFPHDGFFYNIWTLRLEVIGGCLCLLDGPRHFPQVWIMKEYKVKSSWTKCNYVLPHPHAFPVPGCIVSPIYRVGLLLMAVPKDYFKEYCHIYPESLLSLPTDSGQA